MRRSDSSGSCRDRRASRSCWRRSPRSAVDEGGFFCGSGGDCGWSATDLLARRGARRTCRSTAPADDSNATPTDPGRGGARQNVLLRHALLGPVDDARRAQSQDAVRPRRRGPERGRRVRDLPRRGPRAAPIPRARRATSRWAPAGRTTTRSRRSTPRFTICTCGTAAWTRCGRRRWPTTKTASRPTAIVCRRRGSSPISTPTRTPRSSRTIRCRSAGRRPRAGAGRRRRASARPRAARVPAAAARRRRRRRAPPAAAGRASRCRASPARSRAASPG